MLFRQCVLAQCRELNHDPHTVLLKGNLKNHLKPSFTICTKTWAKYKQCFTICEEAHQWSNMAVYDEHTCNADTIFRVSCTSFSKVSLRESPHAISTATWDDSAARAHVYKQITQCHWCQWEIWRNLEMNLKWRVVSHHCFAVAPGLAPACLSGCSLELLAMTAD